MELNVKIPAGQATPNKVASVLAQAGINSNDFCQQFNQLTSSYIKGVIFNVKIHVQPSSNQPFKIIIPKHPFLPQMIKNTQSRKALYELANLIESNPKDVKRRYQQFLATTHAKSILN